jgi:hypothetical protein
LRVPHRDNREAEHDERGQRDRGGGHRPADARRDGDGAEAGQGGPLGRGVEERRGLEEAHPTPSVVERRRAGGRGGALPEEIAEAREIAVGGLALGAAREVLLRRGALRPFEAAVAEELHERVQVAAGLGLAHRLGSPS